MKNKTRTTMMGNGKLLELIARLAPEEAMNQDEQGGCVWCGGSGLEGNSYCDERPECHTTDCPWVEARVLLSPSTDGSDA